MDDYSIYTNIPNPHLILRRNGDVKDIFFNCKLIDMFGKHKISVSGNSEVERLVGWNREWNYGGCEREKGVLSWTKNSCKYIQNILRLVLYRFLL